MVLLLAAVEVLAVAMLIAAIVATPLVMNDSRLVTATGVVTAVVVVSVSGVAKRQCRVDAVTVG